MTPAEVLAGARDVLAERGWHQGDYVGADGSVCLLGALRVALGDRPTDYHWDYKEWDAVAAPVRSVIACRAIDHWNDDPSRTYEDVVLALKRAEELAESS